MTRVFVDSNENRIRVSPTTLLSCGNPVVVATLVEQPGRGYLAEMTDGGAFGDEACPSSYGCPCLSWFGPGERYPDAEAALRGVQVDFEGPWETALQSVTADGLIDVVPLDYPCSLAGDYAEDSPVVTRLVEWVAECGFALPRDEAVEFLRTH